MKELHLAPANCRLHQIDPYTYLVDVLQRVVLHPAREVIELTPRVWKTAGFVTPAIPAL